MTSFFQPELPQTEFISYSLVRSYYLLCAKSLLWIQMFALFMYLKQMKSQIISTLYVSQEMVAYIWNFPDVSFFVISGHLGVTEHGVVT